MILRAHQQLITRLPISKPNIKLPDNLRRHKPDLHVREILAYATHGSG